ncbi:MAG TPA: 2-oxoacid:acceptor oxidoreductase family protein [Gemmatimonadales bacterium]|nr:2-oxoacid:acceptor oxidoreductase family protein [Gemmatimonadales bacterium]
MIDRIMISGSGGDGAVFLGKVLSWAAMSKGYHTTGLPSYGPEIRGGTSRTEVIVADGPIGSPVNTTFESLIVFNDMSLEKFEPGVVPGGLIVSNADVVTRPVGRDDVTALGVHASAEAQKLGNSRLMNVVTLGVWTAKKGDVLDRAALVEGLRHVAKHPKLFELNCQALDRGLALARELMEREAALARR